MLGLPIPYRTPRQCALHYGYTPYTLYIKYYRILLLYNIYIYIFFHF